jgi:hypothetical protein
MLSDEQAIFNQQITALTVLVNSTGRYRIRDGDCYRDPRCAKSYGSPKSLHKSRLARDLILDKLIKGKWQYQRSTKAYEWVGLIWKQLDPKNRWGGDFPHDPPRSVKDGNHFSRAYGGRA